jgi:arsenite methyltransferase
MKAIKQNQKPDYGIDAPGVRNGMMIISLIGLLIVGTDQVLYYVGQLQNQSISAILKNLGLMGFFYGTFMSLYMTWASRVGKLKTRDQLLGQAGELINWTDVTLAIDIGCGKGLMLCGVAKLMSKGQATGYDIWSNKDQSQNSPEATKINAIIEGVNARVNIETADARNLPQDNATVDLLTSHWVVHNIEPQEEQQNALSEMWRVLKPGGVLILADIANVKQYKQYFQNLGANDMIYDDGGFEALVMRLLSGGTYVPQSLICKKPEIIYPLSD